MAKINYQNLPSTSTPLNATNLNTMQEISTSGSNANGDYIKYEDGTLICRTTISRSFATSSAYGNLFESPQIDLGSTPYTFVGNYQLSVTEASGPGVMIEGTSDKTTTSYGKMYVLSAVSRTSYNFTFDIIAIGRWKA